MDDDGLDFWRFRALLAFGIVFVGLFVYSLFDLVFLALGCTLLPFALSLVALRHLSAFSTALAVNMEPVYAIVLAILLLGEQRQLDPAFYLGVAIILAVVFSHPLFVRRRPAEAVLTDGVAGAGQPGRDTSGSA